MDTPWYKNAVFRVVDVTRARPGEDGGLQGVTKRLRHLRELGVSCLLLMPFYPSPRRNAGYDVTDHMAVDPRSGTLDDFAELVERAGEHGIPVMVDLVIGHTSDEHPWFQSSRRDPSSVFRSYYHWSHTPRPPLPGSTGVEDASFWTHDQMAGAYYYHRSSRFEPDLDLRSPEVMEETFRVMDFWLSFGVAGFRLGAAPVSAGPQSRPAYKSVDLQSLFHKLRDAATSRRPDAVLLGQADAEAEKIADLFGNEPEHAEGLSMLFNYPLNRNLALALSDEDAVPIAVTLHRLPASPDTGQWVNVLRDGSGALLPRLPEKKAGCALSLLFSLPGVPMLLEGDELVAPETLKRLARLRLSCPEIGNGAWHLFETDDTSVLAHRCVWKEGTLVAVHNLCSGERKVTLNVTDQMGRRLLDLLEPAGETMLNEPHLTVTLPGYGYRWFRIVGERLCAEEASQRKVSSYA